MIDLFPVQDTFIVELSYASGGASDLYVGYDTYGHPAKTLIQFAYTDIPITSAIISAMLRLYVINTHSTDVTIRFYQYNLVWYEGTGKDTVVSDASTWECQLYMTADDSKLFIIIFH